jgi:hypothetical protein
MVSAPLVVIGPVDRIPLVVVMIPVAVKVPLVVMDPNDMIPLDPYIVNPPLVLIPPTD